jgi:hypothetical protein
MLRSEAGFASARARQSRAGNGSRQPAMGRERAGNRAYEEHLYDYYGRPAYWP